MILMIIIKLLEEVASSAVTYHAFIDTGALITGISNLEAAEILSKACQGEPLV